MTYSTPYKYDPNFHGPFEKRSCTDIPCCLIFLIFIIGWIALAGFAFTQGDPDLLINPTDSEGNICGRGKFENRPYLFFFNLLECAKATVLFTGCPTTQVCVERCPNSTFSVWTDLSSIEEEVKRKMICKYDVDKSKKDAQQLARDGDCASFYLNSNAGDFIENYGIPITLLHRCLPLPIDSTVVIKDDDNSVISDSRLREALEKLAKFNNAKDKGMKIFQDIKIVWKSILFALLASLVVAFIWIFLMRWIAGIMLIFSIFAVLGLFGYLSYYSYTQYKYQRDLSQTTNSTKELIKVSEQAYFNKDTWLVLTIVTAVILGILLLLLIFLRNRIRIAIALIKEGSRAVGCMISSLIFPLLPYALHLAIFVFWGATAVYLASTRKKQFYMVDDVNGTKPCDSENETLIKMGKCKFDDYIGKHTVYGQIYNLVAFLWANFFIMGFGQLSLAGAFASYYWTFDKKYGVPSCAVAKSMSRAIRYHLGSVAFGSLLITIVKMIRLLLEYIESKLKKYEEAYKCAKVCMCLCKCCFWCIEKFMKFINKNAYIMIAVYGENFCTSAKDAFNLIMRNILRTVVLDKAADFLLLIGKLVVVGATGVLSFYFFSGKISIFGYRTPELNYYIIPVVIVTFGSFVIATVFFDVYSMAVDTLFLCFLEDCERNDGSPERPYYMPKRLMKVLGKQNLKEA
ncbi:choline transporter-like protein 2 isoform X3 [Centruroides vittatus]|uniref:choline transporter-like protein 2 isoform X3 n=1 Tax=Centruroides vittatus TaxID=120091 RepID=UPI003510AA3C